jgi:hypothetical protein
MRHDGTPLQAEIDCRIVFPDAAAEPGEEWFYVAYPHGRFTA